RFLARLVTTSPRSRCSTGLDGCDQIMVTNKETDDFARPGRMPGKDYDRPHPTRRWENRVEGTSESSVTLNNWSMAADCPLAAGAPVDEFNNDPLIDAYSMGDAVRRTVAVDVSV